MGICSISNFNQNSVIKDLEVEKLAYREELETIAKIKDIILKFKYNQSSLINYDFKIIKDHKYKRVKLVNYYRHNKLRELECGTCSELMDSAFVKIKKAFPRLHVTRVAGETKVFTHHCFLLVSFQPLLKENFVDNMQKIKQICNQNPYLVDPTYGIVAKVQETSHYVLHKLFRDDYFLSNSNDLIIKKSITTYPLLYESPQHLVSLKIDSNLNLNIYINYLESNLSTEYLLQSPRQLENAIKDPIGKELIYFLRQKELEAEISQEGDFDEILPYYLNDQVLDIEQVYFKDENHLVNRLTRIIQKCKGLNKNKEQDINKDNRLIKWIFRQIHLIIS